MLQTGETVAGYRIERVLGQGGMGVVYEATQLALERTIALKILPAGMSANEEFRERFRREGVLQAKLDHPHIVPVYEAGVADGHLFLAMRLIRGPNLRQLLRSHAIDDARTIRLLRPIAEALDAAHAAGLVHRDIKPQNVLIDESDRSYLADFGLTQSPTTPSLTQAGQFMGTAEYVAPEQIRGEPATPQSDRYSLAAVLFECLGGVQPYVRESQAALLWAHVNDPVPDVRETRPEMPEAVATALAAGLAKDPGERPGQAVELVDAVAAGLEDVGDTIAAPITRQATTKASGLAATGPTLGPSPPRRAVLATLAVGALVVIGALVVALAGGEDDGGGGPPAAAESPRVIGPKLDEGAASRSCADAGQVCTVVPVEHPQFSSVAPYDGVIVSWRVRDARGRMRLAILGLNRTELRRRSALEEVGSTAPTEFTTRMLVAKGDTIALQLQPGAQFGEKRRKGTRYEEYGGVELRGATLHDGKVQLNARIEPDADGDGWGDATQDECKGDPGDDSGC